MDTFFDAVAAAIEPFTPRAVTPNSITIANACLRPVALYAAVVGEGASLRVGLAVCILVSLVLDCLDGTLARARGQTSAVGELLDHALDAVGVPHLALAFIVAIDVCPERTPATLVCASSTVLSVAQCVSNAIASEGQHHPPMDGALAGVAAVGALLVACVFEIDGPCVAMVLSVALLLNSLGMIALCSAPVRATAMTALHLAPFSAMILSCCEENRRDVAIAVVALAPCEAMRVASVYYAESIAARATECTDTNDGNAQRAVCSTFCQAALWALTREVLGAPVHVCICVTACACALQLVERCATMRVIDR